MFYGFVALFDIDLKKFENNNMKPYIMCRILDMKRRTGFTNYSNKSLQFSEKMNFRMEEIDSIDRKANFEVIVIN